MDQQTLDNMAAKLKTALKNETKESYQDWLGKKNKVEYIICAAVHFNDGEVHQDQPVNITKGFVVAGRRHHNCFSTVQSIGSASGVEGIVRQKIHRHDRETQGFLTNTNFFVDRKKAGKIAFEAGQIDEPTDLLFSEDLY